MRYLSLFSGIEACSVAWAPLGWECVAVAEIEPWPSRTLAHHYPDVPNLGDVTKVTEEQIAALGRIDVVVFGSPCQDLSVAGKRKGLDGARSGLFFTAMQIVGWARQWCDCRFALWENVPGAFSSNRGRDFAAVVDAMAGLEGTGVPPKGWGTEGCALGAEAMVEWSTLDAQWFGVAQRRRRVFAIADFGDWRNRPPILLEPEGLRGCAPQVESERPVAGDGTQDGEDAVLAGTWWNGGHLSQTLDAVLYKKQALPEKNRFPAVLVPAWQKCECCDDYVCNIHVGQHAHDCSCPGIDEWAEECLFPYEPLVLRYITPIEAERLQGFPDRYTAIPKAKDGPRYKALGNSMAVPVMRWIGQSIDYAMIWSTP